MKGPSRPTAERPTIDQRRRLTAVGATVVLLVALIGTVLVLSRDDHSFAPAPPRCVEAWNSDRSALALGRHQFSIHRYQRLEILRLTPDAAGAETEASVAAGTCAIVFAAASLDAETASTVQIMRAGRWAPLSGVGAPRERLAELQRNAQADYNAELQPDGTVAPL